MEETPFLDAAIDAVYQKLEAVGGDPMDLPRSIRPMAILYSVQAIIDNGGFRYLFESQFPFSPPYSAFCEAYRQIGAESAAEKLAEAAKRFPFENPETNRDGRLGFMDTLDETDQLFLLGDEVCGDDSIWTQMEDYAKCRPE